MLKDNEIKAEVQRDLVVIKMPIDTLVCAFEFSPDNYEELKVIDKEQFARGVAEYLTESVDGESGLTGFQELLDTIFEKMVEDAQEYISE